MDYKEQLRALLEVYSPAESYNEIVKAFVAKARQGPPLALLQAAIDHRLVVDAGGSVVPMIRFWNDLLTAIGELPFRTVAEVEHKDLPWGGQSLTVSAIAERMAPTLAAAFAWQVALSFKEAGPWEDEIMAELAVLMEGEASDDQGFDMEMAGDAF